MKAIPYSNRLFRGNIYRSIDIAATGMTSQRMRMDAVASNIANAQTTNVDGNGSPYLRRHVIMERVPEKSFRTTLKEMMLDVTTSNSGHLRELNNFSKKQDITPLVNGNEIELPNTGKNVVYDPSHPDADPDGYVTYPDIQVLTEMVDLMNASRAFEANVTVVNAAKQMILKSLDI
ncbi:MAG: flagellar basal body rod protein FlgC [Candidatus Latescibacteria bacterium]|nr:flagellar basal body rod protein FlgC [Candidatus Latescibacterota bacterium]